MKDILLVGAFISFVLTAYSSLTWAIMSAINIETASDMATLSASFLTAGITCTIISLTLSGESDE